MSSYNNNNTASNTKNTNNTWNADNCIICDTPLNPLTGAPNCSCFTLSESQTQAQNPLINPNAILEDLNSIPTFFDTPTPPAFYNSSSNNITPESNYNFGGQITVDSTTPQENTFGFDNNINLDDTEALIREISNLPEPSLDTFNPASNNSSPNLITPSIHLTPPVQTSQPHLHTPVINISTLSFQEKYNNNDSNVNYSNIVNTNTLNANIHSELLGHSISNQSVLSNASSNNSHEDLSFSINPSNLSIIPASPGLLMTPNAGRGRHSRSFSGSSYSSELSSHSLENFSSLKIDNKEKSSITKPNKSSSTNLLSPVNSLFTRLSREPSGEFLNLDALQPTDRSRSSDRLSVRSSSNSRSASRSSSRSSSRSRYDNSDEIDEDKLAKKKEIMCTTCGKYFANNGKLKSHSLTHTDAKPFKCDKPDCDKAFARRSDLRRHERTVHSSIEERESRRQKCGGWCKGILLRRSSHSADTKDRSDNESGDENEWYEPRIVEGEGTQWGCGDEFLRMDGLLKHWRESKLGRECLDSLIGLFGDLSLSIDEETKLHIAKDHVRALKR